MLGEGCSTVCQLWLDGHGCAAESGSADAAASDIISKAMGAKEEATDEPLDTSGNAAAEAADDLLPGVLHVDGVSLHCYHYRHCFSNLHPCMKDKPWNARFQEYACQVTFPVQQCMVAVIAT